ncbi:MAG: hypothetical protein R3301_17320, partial [Saprospiraceae bacterium]|nr:hypothetical protein [Saprospiraceae bacterium]
MRQTLALVFGLLLSLTLTATSSDLASVDSLQIEVDGDTLFICEGTSVVIVASGASDYSWSPATDFSDPTTNQPTLTPSASQWYYVSGMVGDSLCTDSVFVQLFDPTFEVQLSRTDTICPGDVVIATFVAEGPITEITWEPEDSVSSPLSLDTTELAPTETTEYVVTATIGNCTVMDTVTVEVVPFSLRLLTPDTMYLCKPDTDDIRIVLMPADADIIWSSTDTTFEVQVTGSNQVATVFPDITHDYNVTATFRGCTLSHDIHVRVDSLPELDLIVIPVKDPYCAGDEVIIFAADADTLLYPDIEFMWMPMDGQIQDSTNTGNVYVVLQDTTNFVRAVTNNACEDTSQILLNVVPPDIPLSVTDTTLCPGDKFTVEVLDREIEDLEWDPPQGLSCTSCFEPEVTVGESPMYTVTGEKDGCPVSGMLTVGTWSFLPITFIPSLVEACPGDEITVSIDTTGIFNLSITVTGDNSVSCSNCPDPVITV